MENKILLTLLILTFLIGGVIGFYYPKNTERNITENVQQIINNNPSVSVTTISETNKPFTINAQYPQFTLVDQSFNAKIADLINNKIKEFKNNSTENLKAVNETATAENPAPDWEFYFKSDWAPAQINKNYISFVINIYSFSGGAHGNSEVYTFNYDLASKKEISFNDFIGNSEDNLNKISQLAVEDLVNQRGNYGETNTVEVKKELEEGGASPNINNFSTFTFDNQILTIYYQKYQVGPGVLDILKTVFNKSILDQSSVKSAYFK
ncbi:MAG: DUF3298 and DUF4163 domain-containing protein [Candidatus Pacebacteria bacterium]|nr:DUF3298 and DUF4163 domain-containing protein [Candidatus Paceibacterota bacterium]